MPSGIVEDDSVHEFLAKGKKSVCVEVWGAVFDRDKLEEAAEVWGTSAHATSVVQRIKAKDVELSH